MQLKLMLLREFSPQLRAQSSRRANDNDKVELVSTSSSRRSKRVSLSGCRFKPVAIVWNRSV